jgi:cob(I)alamin adenosyltransferase
MVYVFEGDGKGKTSAALGVAVRMLSASKRVLWVSWFKSRAWPVSEMNLPDYFDGRLEMHWMGEGFFIKNGKKQKTSFGEVKTAQTKTATVYDRQTPEGHKEAAREALILVAKTLEEKEEKVPDLIVMDEVIKAVQEGLLTEEEVLKIIKKRRDVHLILTGHVCPGKIKEDADLITRMEKVKHPYDKGVLAIKGLDY